MKIVIKGLDNLMPQGYVETIIDDQNVQKIGLHEEIFMTDGKYRLTTQAHSIAKEQPIQAIVLDKYRLEFLTHSTHSIELMKYGDEVIIYDDGNYTQYQAIVTDISKEQVQGRLWAVTVEFYDINEANYPAGQIHPVDYLESVYVYNKYGYFITTLLFVEDQTTNPYTTHTIHSILVPDLFTDQPTTSNVTAATGENVNTAVIGKQYIEGIFFLREQQKQDVLSVLPLAGDQKIKAYMRVDGNVYNLLETPEFESTKLNAGNLWQVKIKFMYNIVKHYEYV
jgi:hypothetical protein